MQFESTLHLSPPGVLVGNSNHRVHSCLKLLYCAGRRELCATPVRDRPEWRPLGEVVRSCAFRVMACCTDRHWKPCLSRLAWQGIHDVVGSLCRTTTNKKKEDKKRKREEDEKAKAEAKHQEDKVKAEAKETAAAGAEGGDKSDIQADAKSGDTPDAKKAKTGSAGKAEAELEADVSTAALPEAAEVGCY